MRLLILLDRGEWRMQWTLGVPQVLIILLVCAEVAINARKHGKPKTDRSYNLWAALVAGAIEIGILRWGGFF